jgi:hypothetical protein
VFEKVEFGWQFIFWQRLSERARDAVAYGCCLTLQ